MPSPPAGSRSDRRVLRPSIPRSVTLPNQRERPSSHRSDLDCLASNTGLSSCMPRTVHHLGGEYSGPVLLNDVYPPDGPLRHVDDPQGTFAPRLLDILFGAASLGHLGVDSQQVEGVRQGIPRFITQSFSHRVFSSCNRLEIACCQTGPAGGRRPPNRADRSQEAGPGMGAGRLPHQPALQGLELFAGQVALVEEAGEAFQLAYDTPAVGAGVLGQGPVHPFYVGYAAEAHSHA